MRYWMRLRPVRRRRLRNSRGFLDRLPDGNLEVLEWYDLNVATYRAGPPSKANAQRPHGHPLPNYGPLGMRIADEFLREVAGLPTRGGNFEYDVWAWKRAHAKCERWPAVTWRILRAAWLVVRRSARWTDAYEATGCGGWHRIECRRDHVEGFCDVCGTQTKPALSLTSKPSGSAQ